MYKGTAPVFATTKLSDLEWLESQASTNPSTGAPWGADAAMICRRLKIHRYTKRVAKPSVHFKYCGRCFANFLKEDAVVQ